MTTVYFLEATAPAVPLTKRFFAENGAILKDSYPLVGKFTSHKEEVSNVSELCNAIISHADLGHCIVKGQLSRNLVAESRKGTTSTDAPSDWVCLDFDRHEALDIDSELSRMGLGDVSYVLQYSASHGMPGTEGTQSAHVFMLVDGFMPAPEYKAWLMDLNFKHLDESLELARNKTILRWPLDITTCQNDKLLYIATPIFGKGIKDPLGKNRITLVKKKLSKIPIQRIGGAHINALKTTERGILNRLRKAEGLPARTAKTTFVGTCEVHNKPDICTVTDIRDAGDFIRLNLNGGDSWAYWHAKDNFELIHDFKSDSWYKTKELVPGYYQSLIEQRAVVNATPTIDGDLILAFRDMKSAEYYNGLWNPTKQSLELYRAKNETQLDHWMRSHGRALGEFIPIWDIVYDVRGTWVVDEDEHKINLFVPTHYMSVTPNSEARFPAIKGIIRHMLGCVEGAPEDEALVAHFLNWFACIFQRKTKPLTAWVTHGIEGTGKGYFVNKIAMKLLGNKNAMSLTIGNVEDQFNGFMEGKLFVFIDEVDVDDFKEQGKVTAKLRNYITEPTMALRRMRQQTIDVPNTVSFLFSSNRPRPVYIPETDRRYNVGNFQGGKLARPDDEIVSKELEDFAAWLLAHKADIQAANTVMQTEARDRIARLSVNSITETCRSVTNGDFDTLWLAMPDEKLMNASGIVTQHTQNAQAYCMLMRRLAREIIENPIGTVSRDELQIILQYNVGSMPVTPNKFTSLLRHNGIETRQIRHNGQKTYGMDVRWVMSDELRQELTKALKLSKPTLRKVK